MENVENVMGLVHCPRYEMEEKLKKINRSKWSPEQLKIAKRVSMAFRDQTKLIIELKEILRRPRNCRDFMNYIRLRDLHQGAQ